MEDTLLKTMRVCYILPMLDYATGWGRWSLDLLDEMPKHAVEPILIVPPSQKKFHKEYGLDKFETHFWGPEPYLFFHKLLRVNFRGLYDLLTFKNNFESLGKVSLIHAAALYPWGVFGLQLKKETAAPLLLTNHSTLHFKPYRSFADYLLCGYMLKRCDKVSSVSEWSSGQIQAYYPKVAKDKFNVIANGVNQDRFTGKFVRSNKTKTRKHSGPVLLSVTRFIRIKGIETSVLAFAKIKAKFPKAVFYIVGPHTVPSYVKEVRKLIVKHHLNDIHLVGKTSSITELCSYYSEADVLVHTSSSESFGLIFLEAGSFGLPVVATRVGGVPEVVIDGENGILVNRGDHAAIASAVIRVLNDKDLASHLGRRGKEKAAIQNTRKVALDYVRLYLQMKGV